MYQIFIADDEALIREGLKCILDWEELGFSICGEASNGMDTVSEVLEKNPSVVLLDIRMPKKEGIEVIKELRSKDFRGKFIILSGFSDFHYAQAAIRYGASFYLTKPIDDDELRQAILSIKHELDEETTQASSYVQLQSKAKNVVLREILEGIHLEDYLSYPKSKLESMQLLAEKYQVVIYENFSKEPNDNAYSFAEMLQVTNRDNNAFHYINIEHNHVILLKGSYALKRFLDFLAHYERIPQKGSPLDTLFLAFGRPVEQLQDISISYQEALTLVRRRFFCTQFQHTLGYEELPDVTAKEQILNQEKLNTFCKSFVSCLQTFNRKKVAETLYTLENYLYNVKNEITETKLFLTDLYLQIKEQMNHIYSTMNIPFPGNSNIIEKIDRCYYLYEIIQFFSEQFELIMNATGNSSRDTVLDDILYYIAHNFTSNIKLETIAPLFGYNSAYLGKIFTKNTGMSFNSYVDHLRIDYSKELLKQNQLKVYEISEKVGYKNVDYFHKKFKKYVDLSPAEYRKSCGIQNQEDVI